MGYYDDQTSSEGVIGQLIYFEALEKRKGFRPDQLNIDFDDDIWDEIFRAIGELVLNLPAGTGFVKAPPQPPKE